MKKLSYFERSNLNNDEPLINIGIGILYCTIKGRYAWYGRTAQSLFCYSAVHTDFLAAVNCVEKNRKRGTFFRIVEEPCILLQGATKRLYIFGNFKEMGFWIDTEEKRVLHCTTNQDNELFIKGIIQDLREFFNILFSEYTIYESDNKNEYKILKYNIKKSLKSYNSISYGGEYFLGWEEKIKDIAPERLDRMFKIFEKYRNIMEEQKFI